MKHFLQSPSCILALTFSGGIAAAQQQSAIPDGSSGLFCSAFDGPSENWEPCPHALQITSVIDFKVGPFGRLFTRYRQIRCFCAVQ